MGATDKPRIEYGVDANTLKITWILTKKIRINNLYTPCVILL